MLIAIPSKNRIGKIKSQNIFRETGVLYVPESEYYFYKKNYSNKVIAVPKEIKGITATRNFILKTAEDRYIVMLDDDVKFCGYFNLMAGNILKIKLTDEKTWLRECEKLFCLCEDLNYKIFGIKTEGDFSSYRASQPLVTQCYVTASFMGIINDGSYYFDESYEVKEDYEICLRHVVNEGGILGARFLIWENSHWRDKGGCFDYRTNEIEEKCINQLIKQYPRMVIRKKSKTNPYLIKLNF